MRETHQLRLSLPFSQRQILRPIDYFQISTLLFFSDIFSLLFQRKIEIFFFFAGYNLSEEAMAEKDTGLFYFFLVSSTEIEKFDCMLEVLY